MRNKDQFCQQLCRVEMSTEQFCRAVCGICGIRSRFANVVWSILLHTVYLGNMPSNDELVLCCRGASAAVVLTRGEKKEIAAENCISIEVLERVLRKLSSGFFYSVERGCGRKRVYVLPEGVGELLNMDGSCPDVCVRMTQKAAGYKMII